MSSESQERAQNKFIRQMKDEVVSFDKLEDITQQVFATADSISLQ